MIGMDFVMSKIGSAENNIVLAINEAVSKLDTTLMHRFAKVYRQLDELSKRVESLEQELRSREPP